MAPVKYGSFQLLLPTKLLLRAIALGYCLPETVAIVTPLMYKIQFPLGFRVNATCLHTLSFTFTPESMPALMFVETPNVMETPKLPEPSIFIIKLSEEGPFPKSKIRAMFALSSDLNQHANEIPVAPVVKVGSSTY